MCIFCDIKEERIEALKINMPQGCFVLMDKFPISPGHILIISNEHAEFLSDISEAQQHSIMELASRISCSLKESNPNILGFNFLINDGSHAGQHIPHTHMHLIPRYRHDRLKIAISFLFSRINPCNYLGESKSKRIIYEQIKVLARR